MLNELVKYYEFVSRQPDGDFPPDGYDPVKNVAYNLVLAADGTPKAILPNTQKRPKGKKEIDVGFDEIFPARESSPSINAETVDCREKYLFGLEWDNTAEKFVITDSSTEAFEKCKEKNLAFLSDLSSPVIDAYRAFLEKWQPQNERENPVLSELEKSFNGAKFIITAEGREARQYALQNEPAVKEKWDRQWANRSTDSEQPTKQCAVSGKMAPIARVHNNLTGITGGLATGVNLVCFKTSAFWSYGKEQSYNSSVSQEVMEKYTKTFNYLTSKEEHKRQVGDMTLLFWANTAESERPYDEWFWSVMEKTTENIEDTSDCLSDVVGELTQGKSSDWRAALKEDTTYCAVGVKPNSSRLAIKLFEKDNFGNLMANVEKFQAELRLAEDDVPLSVYAVLANLKSPTADNALPSDLAEKLLLSVIKGTSFPACLLENVVRRVKTDRDNPKNKFYAVSRNRIRIIKACLVRSGYYKKGDEYMLENKEQNAAYVCGRLFAVLEKLQKDALGNINASIGDRYLSAASTRPDSVFSRLLNLSRAHSAKLEEGSKIYYDKLLQEIFGLLTDGKFPVLLTSSQQGEFYIGYYQQKKKLYEKKEEKGE